jgi:hypothetical membrane protein
VTVVAGSLRADYSHLHHFISELGATGTPNAALMSYGGFLLPGLLLLGFAFSTKTLLPQGRLARVATVLLVVFAVGVITAGLFSCDVGCPQEGGSLANRIHNQASPLAFLAVAVAAGLLGIDFRKSEQLKSLWLYSVGTSVAALILLGGLGASLDDRVFTGIWQRLFLGTVLLWCAVLGARLYRVAPGASSFTSRERTSVMS